MANAKLMLTFLFGGGTQQTRAFEARPNRQRALFQEFQHTNLKGAMHH